MREIRRRLTTRATFVLAALTLALFAAVGASARDGHGGDDGARAAETRGHDQEQETAKQEDRGEEAGPQASSTGRKILVSSLAPSLPSDPAIHGVAAGGLPWTLESGSVTVRADGRLELEVAGLVIPVAHGGFPAGTAQPVTSVSASLYCAPDGSAAVATTGAVPLSADGDAEIEDTIAVPATCLAPVVLVHPNGGGGAYIAVTGSRS